MDRSRLMPVLVSLALLITMMATPGQAQEKGREILKVKGANAMASICDKWAAQFTEKNPNVRVVVSGGGTALGFDALFDKSADLVMASRKIIPKEIQTGAVADMSPAEVEITRSCVAIITHPNNPLRQVTLEQLRKILAGELTQWSELGGPVEPIIVVTTDQVSGTSIFLREAVMENDYFSSDSKIRPYYHDIIREVAARKPWAIAYCGLADAERAVAKKSIKILGLQREAQSPAVLPSEQTLRDNSYPLILPLFFYWDGAARSPLVQRFVDFCKERSKESR
ncbi:MAG: phosphate ABC transporter substrate-binding protein [Desulfomonile tiedjei]|nr:phosphate ABC transporter substrate-binding protein [Desulfomonile tiedjei]